MGIHPIDRHVGQRIKARRKQLKLSQTELGHKLGISFQQVQKYEKGTNRVAASRLCETARTLGVPVSWLLEGADELLDAMGEGDDAPS